MVVVECVGRETKMCPPVFQEICGVGFGFLVEMPCGNNYEMGGFLKVLFEVKGYVWFIFVSVFFAI